MRKTYQVNTLEVSKALAELLTSLSLLPSEKLRAARKLLRNTPTDPTPSSSTVAAPTP